MKPTDPRPRSVMVLTLDAKQLGLKLYMKDGSEVTVTLDGYLLSVEGDDAVRGVVKSMLRSLGLELA